DNSDLSLRRNDQVSNGGEQTPSSAEPPIVSTFDTLTFEGTSSGAFDSTTVALESNELHAARISDAITPVTRRAFIDSMTFEGDANYLNNRFAVLVHSSTVCAPLHDAV